jgi:hypothetical protein
MLRGSCSRFGVSAAMHSKAWLQFVYLTADSFPHLTGKARYDELMASFRRLSVAERTLLEQQATSRHTFAVPRSMLLAAELETQDKSKGKRQLDPPSWVEGDFHMATNARREDQFDVTGQAAVATAADAVLSRDLEAFRRLIGHTVSDRAVPPLYIGPVNLPPNFARMGLVASESSIVHLCVRVGMVDAVRCLVEAGYPMGLPDSNDETPLSIALNHCPETLELMVTKGHHRRLRYVHPRTGRTFLHELLSHPVRPSARFRRLPLLHYLIAEHGLNARERDAEGLSPLEHAQHNYLQLGFEADAIIEFLENPPRARLSAQAALHHSWWEVAKHPVTRLVLLFLCMCVQVIMYVADHHARGAEAPHTCATALRSYYARTIRMHASALDQFPSLSPCVEKIGVHMFRNLTDDAIAGANTSFHFDSVEGFELVRVTRALHGEGVDYQPFVAIGYRDSAISFPFIGDIFNHIAYGWDPSTDLIACKIITIVVGALIGGMFFAIVVHGFLRDVLRLTIFGADYWAFELKRIDRVRIADRQPNHPSHAQNSSNRDDAAVPISPHRSSLDNYDSRTVNWFGWHSSPALRARAGNGRGVCIFYGVLTGVYCGGLVFNVFLQHVFEFGDATQVQRLRMTSVLKHPDASHVTLGELWVVEFSVSLGLFALIFCAVLDELAQALAAQLFLPSPWFSRFGKKVLQETWPQVRIPVTIAFTVSWWAATVYLFVGRGTRFSWYDLPNTLLRTNHVAVNIFLGGVALLIHIGIALQCWTLPRLQALVVVTRPGSPRMQGFSDPSKPSKAGGRYQSDAPGQPAQQTLQQMALRAEADRDDMANRGNYVDDDDVEIAKARKQRRAQLLQAVADAQKADAALSNVRREKKEGIVMSRECEVVNIRSGFKVLFLGMRGNLCWQLWTLLSWAIVQDAYYLSKYLTDAANRPESTHPSDVGNIQSRSMFSRAGDSTDGEAVADVVCFSFAVLPAAVAVLLLLGYLIRCSMWVRRTTTSSTSMLLPMVDETSGDMIAINVPAPRHEIRIGHRLARRATTVTACIREESQQDRNAAGHQPGGRSMGTSSFYDSAGASAVVNVWACAYRDDVVRLGALLDADPSLVNERGGIGIAVRPVQRPAPQEEALPFHLPGATGEAFSPRHHDFYAPPLSTPRSSHFTQRTAELLDGTANAMYYAATPLHYAVLGNARSSVGALLHRGANPQIRCANGLCTAHELARMLGHDSLLHALLSAT